MKVAVIGGSGGIGQPVSMMMKNNPMVKDLRLYDVPQAFVPVVGVAADLSHIDTDSTVRGFCGEAELPAALEGVDAVLMIPGGARLQPGMTREQLFDINGKITETLARAMAKHCPKAVIVVVSNPVNSSVPLIAEIFKEAGVYDWRKVLGVCALDVMRAHCFVAQLTNAPDFSAVSVPVVGGHAGPTIMPLLSQAKPIPVPPEHVEEMDLRIQNAFAEVVNAKAGAGSATLSTALATVSFANLVLKGLAGQEPKETASCLIGGRELKTEYFSLECSFGTEGVSRVTDLDESVLTDHEKKRLEEVFTKLAEDIQLGVDFVKKPVEASAPPRSRERKGSLVEAFVDVSEMRKLASGGKK